ncbi:hypothetical protein IWX78_001757 [Mycetocola sp. CAN_C7]|uniref:hypothetical protein n=1 Tax=Mycetocola sp. CAN_C7 TaxID=2787724 RepID=UPI0018CB295E
MTAHLLRRISRLGKASVGVAVAAVIAFSGASSAAADPIDSDTDRTLSLTRADGSPIGTLFSDWTMVPGDIVHTTVVAHRTGGGESSLMITLGDGDEQRTSGPTAVERDVLITVAGNGIEVTSSAADLKHTDAVFDLGRSSAASVPIDVTFELPFSSGNGTQLQSLDLGLVVIAADMEIPASTDGLASTGASVRDALIVAAVVTCLGLLLIGGRNRRVEAGEHD